jgi:hypothetical protein
MRSTELLNSASSSASEPEGRAVPRTAPEPEHVTLAEAADWLRCSPRTLERLIADRTGPPVIRVSERRLIFRMVDLRKWLTGRTHGATELLAPRRPGRPGKSGHPPGGGGPMKKPAALRARRG